MRFLDCRQGNITAIIVQAWILMDHFVEVAASHIKT
jgi:hypothetical protein